MLTLPSLYSDPLINSEKHEIDGTSDKSWDNFLRWEYQLM